MKVFTDKTETSFFKTDNHVKNLHEIEIKSIKDFVLKYSLDPFVLLGGKSWMVTRFDELISGSPIVDLSDEPELHGEWLEVDFVNDMTLLDILFEINKYAEIDSLFLQELKESGVFRVMSQDWINDDEDERWSIAAWNDSRLLTIIINENNKVTVRFDATSRKAV